MAIFKGAGVAIVTPMYDNEEVNYDKLEELINQPVVLWDERRTTIEAHQILSDNNYHGKKRKKTVDAVAASLILEGYLSYLRTHKE